MYGTGFAASVFVTLCFWGVVSTSALAQKKTVVRGSLVQVDCLGTPLVRVPGGPVSGPDAVGDWYLMDSAAEHILLQAWNPEKKTSDVATNATSGLRGWVPQNCVGGAVTVVDIRTVSNIAALSVRSAIFLVWDPQESDALEQLQFFQEQRMEWPDTRMVLVARVASKNRATEVLGESGIRVPLWLVEEGIPEGMNSGVWVIDAEGQQLRWPNTWRDLNAADLHTRVNGPPDPGDQSFTLDLALRSSAVKNEALSNSQISDACERAAVASTVGKHQEYIRWAAAKVREKTFFDVAFWDTVVHSGKDKMIAGEIADCMLDAVASFVVLRVNGDDFTVTNRMYPRSDSIGPILTSIAAQSNEGRQRVLWITNGPDDLDWPDNVRPLRYRTLRIVGTPSQISSALGKVGIAEPQSGGVVVVY